MKHISFNPQFMGLAVAMSYASAYMVINLSGNARSRD